MLDRWARNWNRRGGRRRVEELCARPTGDGQAQPGKIKENSRGAAAGGRLVAATRRKEVIVASVNRLVHSRVSGALSSVAGVV